jgi:TolB-like protein/DNA-binding winged helix-turn-helix (wHTH) protein/Tfp pilus assembly protein PilF
METRPLPQVARFGIFEVDLPARELHKRGLKVKLQEQPFQVLAALLEHAGEVVSRDELRQRIWPADTFVDFDNGLNGAINRLREALGDSADSPRFVETVPRRGYRFIASLEHAAPEVAPSALPSNGAGQAEPASVAKLTEDTPGVARARRRPRSLWGLAPSAGRSLRRLWIVALGFGTLMALLIGLNAGGMRQRFLGRASTSPVPSIAVLPFKNLSSEPADDYFSDGLTDEIIRNLSIIDGLQVRSRTSSFAFKDKPRNIHEVGVELGATLVLEGSVLRSGDKLRINAQLVRVSDDVPLWSQRFDRELKDVFAIQDEISRGIVNSLRLKLGRGQRRYETSVEAYDLYLRARTLDFIPGVFQQEVGLFEAAIAKDPSFAPAYAGLAETYASYSVGFPAERPSDELAKMRAASEKAIQLDPLLAEAHDALGVVLARDGQWAQAEKSFHRAIELDPNRSRTYPNYSFWLLTVLGRIEEALQQMRVAERADPLSPDVRGHLAVVLILAGRYSEAAEHCLRLPADYPFKRGILARARLGQGKTEEAIQILGNDQTRLIGQARGILGYAYARSGRREEAEKMAGSSKYANEQALIFAGLGDKDRTLEALDRMAALGPVRVGQYLNFPELALLKGDPRVKALRKKIGLPE